MVDMSNRNCTNRFANKVNLVSLNILDNHDSLFGQEVERKLVGSIFQDTFLDEKHISSGSHYLFDHFCNDLSFFFHDSVHGLIVLDNHTVLKVSFGSSNLELNHSNFGVFDLSRPSTC